MSSRYLTKPPPRGRDVILGVVDRVSTGERTFRAQLWERGTRKLHGYYLPRSRIHKAQRHLLRTDTCLWMRRSGGTIHLIRWRPLTRKERAAAERRFAKTPLGRKAARVMAFYDTKARNEAARVSGSSPT